jgi:biopolymer transport protein ExbD
MPNKLTRISLQVMILLLSISLFSCKSKNSNQKIVLYKSVNDTITENPFQLLIPKKTNSNALDFTIKIDANSHYYFNNIIIQLPDLKDRLKAYSEKSSEPTASLQVDKSVKMDKIVEVMNTCKKLKIKLIMKTE